MEKPGSKLKIIVGIPAFNEEAYIGTVVLKTRQYAGDVIVVDDGSSDQTANVATLAGATVVRHQANSGYGASIKTLLSEAKKRSPDVFVILDGDSQHNPNDIPAIIQPISEGYDLVIGSREQQKKNIPRYRRVGQGVISGFSHLLSGTRLADSESGFRAFSGKAVSVLELKENGMAVSAETIARAVEKGLKITERPISIRYTADSSTMNPVVHGFSVLGRILAMISERKPLFFFGVSGAILTFIGFLIGLHVVRISFGGGLMPTGTALVSAMLLIIGVFSFFTGIILNVLTRRAK